MTEALYQELMADYGTLFLLVLTALTFVLVGMAFVVYLMILGEREKNRLKAQLESFGKMNATLVCPHSFGYLSGYPQSDPIPDECFGCPKAVECMNGKKKQDSNSVTTEETKLQS